MCTSLLTRIRACAGMPVRLIYCQLNENNLHAYVALLGGEIRSRSLAVVADSWHPDIRCSKQWCSYDMILATTMMNDDADHAVLEWANWLISIDRKRLIVLFNSIDSCCKLQLRPFSVTSDWLDLRAVISIVYEHWASIELRSLLHYSKHK